MKERCYRCKFWTCRGLKDLNYESTEPKNRIGTCHRFPPQLDLSDFDQFVSDAKHRDDVHSYLDYRMWNWPVTRGRGWCGEFQVSVKKR